MRIAYLNNDEVHQALAAAMAGEFGAVICARPPQDPPPDGLFDAVLYDLDDQPRDRRSALLDELRRMRPSRPAAVHGFDITDEQARALGRDGVAAARRLNPGLIRSLVTAARCAHQAVTTGNDGTELTWVDLDR